jgi:hypothetical protein
MAVAEYTIIGVTDSKTINSNNGTSNGYTENKNIIYLL